MSDEPDGDPEDDPSETTSEEDPFIYPADDSDDAGGTDASSTDSDATQSGADTSPSDSGTYPSDSGTSPSDSGTSSSGSDATARDAETSTSGADSSATDDGTSSTDSSSGASAAAGAGADRSSGSSSSGGRTGGSNPTSSPSGTGKRAAASPSGGAARSSGGTSTGTGSARSASAGTGATDVGRHATDRRPHASESGQTRPPSPSSGGHGRQRRQEAPTESGPTGVGGWVRWFWTTDEGPAVYLRDVVTSVAAVLVVGLVLFAISGIWPPMVAVESGSMEPNMQVGDLVFIVDNERYSPDGSQEHQGESTGVVPADRAAETGRSKFGGPGDVIVFRPNGLESTTPVIHRAMLWVQEGENWYDRADPDAVGTANDCAELNHCPAPHAGFITKGDNNPRYDQQTTLSKPVRPEWVVGTAELRIPYLGHIRLAFSGQVAPALDGGLGPSAAAERPTTPSATTVPATAGSRTSGAVA